MFKVDTTQHVLAVKDLAANESYFLNELGFTLRFRVDGWSFVQLQGFYVMMGECPDDYMAKETNDHSYYAYVNCTDIDALYAQYLKSGALVHAAPEDKPWGLREFGVSTPEGHRIMFGQEISTDNLQEYIQKHQTET